MKHKIADDVNVNVNVDIPAQDLEHVIIHVTVGAIAVIGFYMATDTVRHIFKTVIK